MTCNSKKTSPVSAIQAPYIRLAKALRELVDNTHVYAQIARRVNRGIQGINGATSRMDAGLTAMYPQSARTSR